VHIVSGGETDGKRAHALRAGAVAFLQKPLEKEHLDDTFQQIATVIERGARNLLVVEDDDEQPHGIEEAFKGKKVLIVDDDVRNVFALTSVLEAHGMEVIFAENGREGLETLRANPQVDLVLMDIMMPEMDGYRTMAAVRKLPQFKELPIISLTAKAMQGAARSRSRQAHPTTSPSRWIPIGCSR